MSADNHDSTLKLLVQIGVMGQEEAEKAAASLKKLNHEAGQVGKGHGSMRAFRREAGDVMEFVDKAAGETGLPMVTMALKKYRYELMMAGYEASQKFPAMAEAIGRVALVATGAVVVYETLMKSLEETNKQLDEQGKAAAKAETGWAEFNRTIGVDTIKELLNLEKELGKAGESYTELAQVAKDAGDEIKSDFEGYGKMMEGANKLEMAQLKMLYEQKLVSEEAFQKRKADLEIKFAAEARQRQEDELAAQIKAKEAYAAEAAAHAEKNRADFDKAADQSLKAQADYREKERASKEAPERLKAAKEALDKFEEANKLGPIGKTFWNTGDIGDFEEWGPSMSRKRFVEARRESGQGAREEGQDDAWDKYNQWSTLKNAVAQSGFIQKATQRQHEDATVTADAAKQKLDDAREQAKSDAKLKADLERDASVAKSQLDALREQHRIAGKSDKDIAAVEGIHKPGKDGSGLGLDEVISRGESAMAGFGRHGKMSAKELADFRQLETMVSAAGNSQDQTHRIMVSLLNHTLTHKKLLDDMEKRIGSIGH